MAIVAVDPGPHTGLATRLDDGRIETTMIYLKVHEIWKYLMTVQPRVIICERFRTAGRISQAGLDTVEIQGGVAALAYQLGATMYWQSPADRKPWEAQARAALGANRTKIQSHPVDALAHLFRWEYMESQGRQRAAYTELRPTIAKRR